MCKAGVAVTCACVNLACCLAIAASFSFCSRLEDIFSLRCLLTPAPRAVCHVMCTGASVVGGCAPVVLSRPALMPMILS